jgi:hypothetical protein
MTGAARLNPNRIYRSGPAQVPEQRAIELRVSHNGLGEGGVDLE